MMKLNDGNQGDEKIHYVQSIVLLTRTSPPFFLESREKRRNHPSFSLSGLKLMPINYPFSQEIPNTHGVHLLRELGGRGFNELASENGNMIFLQEQITSHITLPLNIPM